MTFEKCNFSLSKMDILYLTPAISAGCSGAVDVCVGTEIFISGLGVPVLRGIYHCKCQAVHWSSNES